MTQHKPPFLELKPQVRNIVDKAFYSLNDECLLYADGGPSALGAILVQQDNVGRKRVVVCASASLTGAETRYSQSEKEALAFIWAVRRFDYYLR